MADAPSRFSPLQGYADRFADLPSSGVSITEEPFAAMADLWVDPSSPAATTVGALLGADLPTAPNTAVTGDTATAIWLGPEEWLITTAERSGPALEVALQSAVRESGGAATDVSAQRTTIRVSGPQARHVLAKGCSLDLHPRVATVGTALQTMLGLAAVVIVVLDDDGTDYRLLVRSSFARYVAEWLLDASSEFAADRRP